MKPKHPLLLRIFLACGIFALILLTAFLGTRSMLKTLYPLRYTDFVETYSKENNLSTSFVLAVIKCESDFSPKAVSYVGAKGLMQIMPETEEWIKGKLKEEEPFDIFDEETNIRFGCYLYGYLFESFKTEREVIAAYHAGMGNVRKWLKDEKYSSDGSSLSDIPFPSTKAYVEKVQRTEKIYQILYGKQLAEKG